MTNSNRLQNLTVYLDGQKSGAPVSTKGQLTNVCYHSFGFSIKRLPANDCQNSIAADRTLKNS